MGSEMCIRDRITGGLISLFLLGAIVGGISVVIVTNVLKDVHKDDDS